MLHKRQILKWIIFLAALGSSLSCKGAHGAEEAEASGEPNGNLVFSVNAYSFSDLLSAKDFRDQEQVYTLFNLLDWCHDKGIKGLDPTGYFFPTYPEVPPRCISG